jgi:hypothetical protein
VYIVRHQHPRVTLFNARIQDPEQSFHVTSKLLIYYFFVPLSIYKLTCNNISTQEITREEFSRKIEMSSITKAMSFDSDATPPFTWVHFEGRNIYETAAQIDWLESKATREGWRSQLTISIELEKPDRPHIDVLLTRVGSPYIYYVSLSN